MNKGKENERKTKKKINDRTKKGIRVQEPGF